MKYEFIILDIDGTLIDSEFAILASLQKTIEKFTGETKPVEALKFSLGIPSMDALKTLGVKENLLKEAYNLWNINFEKYIPDIKPYSGIVELLDVLSSRKLKLGILTSKDKIEYEKDFLPLGLESYFNHIIVFEDTTNHKPHPEPMLKMLEMACVPPEKALYIGDSIYDMQCAEGAGVDSVLALWGREGIDGIEATYYAKGPADILKII